jgi:hypothetical protein
LAKALKSEKIQIILRDTGFIQTVITQFLSNDSSVISSTAIVIGAMAKNGI